MHKFYYRNRMNIIKTTAAMQTLIAEQKADGKMIGFIPTMGALHQGHLSLIEAANQACNLSICSIFVNPTQFNDKEDYDKYPRTHKEDLALLEEAKCDFVFMPTYEEMYPEHDERVFDFKHLENVMEGAHRPGHFNGVAQIVSKLFDAVPANKAFFGQKDFQQVVIIKDLVRQLEYDIEIIACPIVRQNDGLAMSSRNQRLSETERSEAAKISQILRWAKDNHKSFTVEDLKSEVVKQFEAIEALELEYFEIVEEQALKTVKNWNMKEKIVACVAVFCGKVRLIDNIVFPL